MIQIAAFLQRAKESIVVAEWCFEHGYVCRGASSLYFASFQLLYSILGKPKIGKWSHQGIENNFRRYAMEKQLFDKQNIRKIARLHEKLYNYRKVADYEEGQFNENKIIEMKDALHFIKEVIHHVAG